MSIFLKLLSIDRSQSKLNHPYDVAKKRVIQPTSTTGKTTTCAAISFAASWLSSADCERVTIMTTLFAEGMAPWSSTTKPMSGSMPLKRPSDSRAPRKSSQFVIGSTAMRTAMTPTSSGPGQSEASQLFAGGGRAPAPPSAALGAPMSEAPASKVESGGVMSPSSRRARCTSRSGALGPTSSGLSGESPKAMPQNMAITGGDSALEPNLIAALPTAAQRAPSEALREGVPVCRSASSSCSSSCAGVPESTLARASSSSLLPFFRAAA
mmetsp:Transcript_6216/g.14852  ORF Transcript_6216/g.14852 Transcript_6216/m.14852 type:complete len:267 (+) Transcript_6216:70-870(+)